MGGLYYEACSSQYDGVGVVHCVSCTALTGLPKELNMFRWEFWCLRIGMTYEFMGLCIKQNRFLLYSWLLAFSWVVV
jgi:hypothetical protein